MLGSGMLLGTARPGDTIHVFDRTMERHAVLTP
jgi:hypothetical protein